MAFGLLEFYCSGKEWKMQQCCMSWRDKCKTVLDFIADDVEGDKLFFFFFF